MNGAIIIRILVYVQKLGRVWMPDSETPTEIVESISKQLGVQSWKLQDYANRDETRREHLSDLMDSFGWITMPHKGYLNLSPWLLEIAMGSDHGMHPMVKWAEVNIGQVLGDQAANR